MEWHSTNTITLASGRSVAKHVTWGNGGEEGVDTRENEPDLIQLTGALPCYCRTQCTHLPRNIKLRFPPVFTGTAVEGLQNVTASRHLICVR